MTIRRLSTFRADSARAAPSSGSRQTVQFVALEGSGARRSACLNSRFSLVEVSRNSPAFGGLYPAQAGALCRQARIL